MRAWGRIREHGGKRLRKKICAVGILQQGHHGQLDAGGMQPVGQLGIGGYVEPAIGRGALEFFRYEQVEFAIMLLKRSEAGGIPAYIERSAKRIIVVRHLAKGSNTLFASMALDGRAEQAGHANATKQRPRI